MDRQIFIFAVDIETRGQGPRSHGIVSIGVCVGSTKEEKVLEKARFDLLPLPQQFIEERCQKEFWDKHPDLYKTLQLNAKPFAEAMKSFGEFIQKWDDQGELYIVSDNPGFDFGFINYYMDLSGQHTLNYKVVDGVPIYRNTHDADSYGRGKCSQTVKDPWFCTKDHCPQVNPGLQNHMPEDDAEYIYRTHYNIQKV